jgi:hypothetical protein
MKILMVLAAATLVAAPAFAADNAGAARGFSASGDGMWEMVCKVVVSGDWQPVVLQPGRSEFNSPRLTQVECRYRASAKSDLVVSVNGAETCPLAGASADGCSLTIPKGKGGVLNFKFGTSR